MPDALREHSDDGAHRVRSRNDGRITETPFGVTLMPT
jgi:hypothetical protein